MNHIDLTKTLKGKNKWVSLSKDYKKVIAEGKTLQDLLRELKKKGNPEGYILRSANDYSSYVG